MNSSLPEDSVASNSSPVPPLKIYILWHPDFHGEKELSDVKAPVGETKISLLAKSLIRFFQRTGTDLQEGLGIPTYIRSQAAPGGGDGLPLDIRIGEAEITLLVVFIDDLMVGDNRWEHWISDLSQRPGFVVFSVAFTEAATHWSIVKSHNLTRLYEEALDDRSIRLKRDLLSYCVSLLLRSGDGVQEKAGVFISYHRETDLQAEENATVWRHGRRVAQSIYDAAGNYSSDIFAFFAEKTLGKNVFYEREIQRFARQSAVMLSVFTERYLERTWCRNELQWAREPRKILGSVNSWEMTPLFVIDALSGFAASIPMEFTGCSMIRWQSEDTMEIIDRALAEALISAFHRRWAAKISGENRIVISWVPDSVSLTKLKTKGLLPGGCELVYPGYGISVAELSFLQQAFPNLRFRKFEDT